MNKPKHHHYVPQFYLRQFSSTGERVSVWFKKLAMSLDNQLPARFAGINHLYRIDKLGISDMLIYEKAFSTLEGHAAPIIDKLRHKNDLSWEDVSDLAFFIGTLAERGPYNINFMKYMLSQGIKVTKKLIKNNEYSDPIGMDGLLKDFDTPEDIQFCTMLMLFQQALYLAQIIADKGWHFFHSVNHPFITSDRPVSFYTLNQEIFNRTHADTDVIIPLTRHICLLATSHLDELPLHIDADLEIVNALNAISFSNAKQFAFGDSSETLKYVANLNTSEYASICQSTILFGISKEFPSNIFEDRNT